MNNNLKLVLTQKYLSSIEKFYILKQLKRGTMLIDFIKKRESSIKRIMDFLIKFQIDFWEKGIGFLRPLKIQDVAKDMGMHNSTISRIIYKKIINTKQGNCTMKSLFTRGYRKIFSNKGISNKAIKIIVEELILREYKYYPIKDSDLVMFFSKKGLRVNRRTITKYRNELNILSYNLRK